MEVELASTSSSYQVFMSFRGEDTRRIFIDYLYNALVQAGIRTFRDEEELAKGKNIGSELHRAISESKISVIIFSKGYASSTWCLDELLKILEFKRTSGQMILPIFYHIDPSEVRKQKGSFAKAFASHFDRLKEETAEKRKEGLNKIDRWKNALKEVANMTGMVLEDENELKFIQKILNEINKKLNRTVMGMPSFIVGIDHHLAIIKSWLKDESNVGIMTICGLGGTGKTTIVKAVYNENFDGFECRSFLTNIRERSEQPNGLVCLQRQLLSDTSGGKRTDISCIDEGLVKIRNVLSGKRFLIILDDVDHMNQLNALLIGKSSFFGGSKIIITTRHEKLLKVHEKYIMHKIDGLKDFESLRLFCWHAFGQGHPLGCYVEHTKRIVRHCEGLPLALEIFGSSLSGRSPDFWERYLKKLETIPEKEILKKLAVSYDSLQDDHDKNLFLDIACFFVGKDKDYVITILEACNFCTKVGTENLIDRCLVKIDAQNKLTMHQLVQDMAREIVRQESPKEPGKRSRLWHPKDLICVLKDYTGTEMIEGLILNLNGSEEDKRVGTFFSDSNLKRCNSECSLNQSAMLCQKNSLKRRCLGFLSWLPINIPSIKLTSKSDDVGLHTGTFSRMHRLRLLQLNNVLLNGDFEEFPKMLRWLSWRALPLKSIPINFSLESLVVLDMRYSQLEYAWKGAISC